VKLVRAFHQIKAGPVGMTRRFFNSRVTAASL
jgi:hypothetical protein